MYVFTLVGFINCFACLSSHCRHIHFLSVMRGSSSPFSQFGGEPGGECLNFLCPEPKQASEVVGHKMLRRSAGSAVSQRGCYVGVSLYALLPRMLGVLY